MIRSGIYSLGQLNRAEFKDIFGKEKNISINLYTAVEQVDDSCKRNDYAELILNRFNSDRNVIKRTYKNRFDEFDKYSIRIIADQNLEKIFILDTAISDGRASCYFLEESIKQLQNLWYTGSDINVDYYLKKKNSAGKYYIVTDKSNKIIEITLPPFVWNLARTEGSFYFLNNFLKSYFSRKSRNELVKNEFKYTEKIELIHPDYRKLIKCDNCFQVRNYNLFEKVTEKYNVIRAMNIIHPGYFSRDQLILILSNLYEGLEMNGLLIEGSNENVGSPVEGAIYKKVGNGFLLICEPERPSRIRELVLGFSPKRQYE